jgi:hypothetical protein
MVPRLLGWSLPAMLAEKSCGANDAKVVLGMMCCNARQPGRARATGAAGEAGRPVRMIS